MDVVNNLLLYKEPRRKVSETINSSSLTYVFILQHKGEHRTACQTEVHVTANIVIRRGHKEANYIQTE